MYDAAPGTTLIAQGASAGGMLSSLIPGDLVFQDASTNDGTAIDHVGIYLGKDTQGNYRFVSSRKTANGPTLGDVGGKSTLNGTGLFARTFVAAKRL
jgi:cell wall-associated NlpC family hydrolase